VWKTRNQCRLRRMMPLSYQTLAGIRNLTDSPKYTRKLLTMGALTEVSFLFPFKSRQEEENGSTSSTKLTLRFCEQLLLLVSYSLGTRLIPPRRFFPLTQPHASLRVPLHEHPTLPSYCARRFCTTWSATKGSRHILLGLS
jgi:hypothetical protein